MGPGPWPGAPAGAGAVYAAYDVGLFGVLLDNLAERENDSNGAPVSLEVRGLEKIFELLSA